MIGLPLSNSTKLTLKMYMDCMELYKKATKLQTTGNNLVRSIKATYFHDMSYQFLCFGEKGVRQHGKFGRS